jgi:hypothetical protein
MINTTEQSTNQILLTIVPLIINCKMNKLENILYNLLQKSPYILLSTIESGEEQGEHCMYMYFA